MGDGRWVFLASGQIFATNFPPLPAKSLNVGQAKPATQTHTQAVGKATKKLLQKMEEDEDLQKSEPSEVRRSEPGALPTLQKLGHVHLRVLA